MVPAALAAATLAAGRHAVANLLRRTGGPTGGEASGHRRVLSAARWSEAKAGRHPARLVRGLVPEGSPAVLVGDLPRGPRTSRVRGDPRPLPPGGAASRAVSRCACTRCACTRCACTRCACLYARPPQEHRVGGAAWAGKRHVTFSDALPAVGRPLWRGWASHAPARPSPSRNSRPRPPHANCRPRRSPSRPDGPRNCTSRAEEIGHPPA